MNLFQKSDELIIEKLESAMLYSPVSPYAVARFSITGFALASLIFGAAETLEKTYFQTFICFTQLCWSKYNYKKTFRLERENLSNRLNSEKPFFYIRQFSLLCCLMFLLLLSFDLNPISLVLIVQEFCFVFSLYFMTLNWIKPNKKQKKFVSNLAFNKI